MSKAGESRFIKKVSVALTKEDVMYANKILPPGWTYPEMIRRLVEQEYKRQMLRSKNQ